MIKVVWNARLQGKQRFVAYSGFNRGVGGNGREHMTVTDHFIHIIAARRDANVASAYERTIEVRSYG